MRRGENFEEALKLCFKNVPVNLVIEGTIAHSCFPKEHFRRMVIHHFKEYSDTEIDGLYEWMREKSNDKSAVSAELNLFNVLIWSASEILIQADNQILCKYPELIRWKNLTSVLGEDMLVCAYLSHWSIKTGEQWRKFDWLATLPHNNIQLNRVLERGLSENHFHLYGSTPVVQLMWQAFMNSLCNDKIESMLQIIDEERRSANVCYNAAYKEQSFCVLRLQAALIRVCLMIRIANEEENYKHFEVVSNCKEILNRAEDIRDYRFQIQAVIALFNEQYFQNKVLGRSTGNYVDDIFLEERWFLYQIFYEYQRNPEKWIEDMNLFYAYLIIKTNLAAEVIQNNDLIGFKNFQILQGRKNILFNISWGKEKMVQQAIMGSMQTGNIRSMEIRISPSDHFQENIREILYLDSLIKGSNFFGEQIEENWFFYVYHFIKGQDNVSKVLMASTMQCRNSETRKKARKQATAIMELRNWAPKIAQRVLGIDACSQELGCRPEVFGSVFRELRNHVCIYQNVNEEVPQLRTTYHVGEEFLDMVDGLRAIEEAIRFLDFCCGDRLGHATVLGISVPDWYQYKRYLIHISIQDYLDNVVWFYHKLVEFKIEGCEVLKDYLLKEFEKYFSEIYRKYINFSILAKNSRNSRNRHMDYQFDIYTYYDSWKLRGDEPELYRNGEYAPRAEFSMNKYLLSSPFLESEQARNRPEVALLYYMYHFDPNVRKVGMREEEIRISDIYIDGVQKIQKEMQHFVSVCGIGIETNPSSNLFISSIKSYKEHPIVNLYNKGLVWDVEKLKECPQLYVSINTDDKGIFQTSLENEYSLIACDLEKAKDAKGHYVYNRQMIYDWLDAIRKMGNQQSFRKGN